MLLIGKLEISSLYELFYTSNLMYIRFEIELAKALEVFGPRTPQAELGRMGGGCRGTQHAIDVECAN